MKQGMASHSNVASTKTEPRSTAAIPAGVASLGIAHGNHTLESNPPFSTVPVFNGQGLQAPMAGTTIHHCGTQGKSR